MTAEHNLKWGGGHLQKSEQIGPGKFKNWNFGNAISCDLVIKFSVALLVALQDLVTLWSRNAIRAYETASVVKSGGW